MVSNQVLGARLLVGLLTLGAVYGCAHTHGSEAAAPAAAAPVANAASVQQQDMTATEAALSGMAPVGAPTSVPVTSAMLKAGAPMQYTVKRGDTLWGIASMYLKDPWLWPEVWVINPHVPNPHLIYPGDTLNLAIGANGAVQVSVGQPGAVRLDPRLRTEPLGSAIPTLPYTAIAAFLSHPTVVTEEQIRRAPYVMGFRDMHQAGGSDNEVYLRNLNAGQNARFAIVHVAGPLVDPDDGKVVGYEGIYTGTALVQRPGEPAKAVLIDSARETLRGDRLLSTDNEHPVSLTPRPPSQDIHGTIIDVVGGVDLVGQFEVLVINRGARNGLEAGNVLAIDHLGEEERDLYRNGKQIGDLSGWGSSFAPVIKLPNERSGTLLVFKVFDRVSYGLVVGANDIIYVGDLVSSP